LISQWRSMNVVELGWYTRSEQIYLNDNHDVKSLLKIHVIFQC
jgi:hypothetical protein